MPSWIERKRAAQAAHKKGQAPKLWLIDMDNTLFNASDSMLEAIHLRMRSFIAQRLGLPEDEAAVLQDRYWAQYGATFLGLWRHHGIDPVEFWRETHSFNLRPFVKSDLSHERLRAILTRLTGKKVLVTNGPGFYAREVLRILELDDVFDMVAGADDLREGGRWRCKPDPSVYLSLCSRLHESVRGAVLVEDSLSNLRSAKSLGMRTVWCIGYRQPHPNRMARPAYVDAVVENLSGLEFSFSLPQ